MWKTLLDTLTIAAQTFSLVGRPAARGTGDTRHLGLLSWYLPPHTNAGVFRPASWLRHSEAAGWRLTAVGGRVPASEQALGGELRAQVGADNRLIEITPSGREPAWRLTPDVDGGFVNAVDMAHALVDAVRDDLPVAIVATGPPFSTFVGGYLASKRLGRPLVLDYRDEWSECPFDFVSKGRDNRIWELRCLQHAAAVIYTTESLRRHAIASFPEVDLARKATVIPNGTELDDFAPPGSPAASPAGEPFTLVHVGALAGHTPPGPLLSALDEGFAGGRLARDALAVHFIGRRSKEAEAALAAVGCQHSITLIDQVPKREAIARMQAASALLLIADPRLARYMPSKLFDYVAARRPVLVYGHDGEASRVVEQLGIGVRCSPEDGCTGLARALDRLRTLPMTPQEAAVQEWLDGHRRGPLADRFFSIVETMAGR